MKNKTQSLFKMILIGLLAAVVLATGATFLGLGLNHNSYEQGDKQSDAAGNNI